MNICLHVRVSIHSYSVLDPLLGADNVSGGVIVGGSLLFIIKLMAYNLVDDCHEVINCTFPCDEFGCVHLVIYEFSLSLSLSHPFESFLCLSISYVL